MRDLALSLMDSTVNSLCYLLQDYKEISSIGQKETEGT